MSSMPRLLRIVPAEAADRAFWLAVREALLLMVKAIERRHLPGLKKSTDRAFMVE